MKSPDFGGPEGRRVQLLGVGGLIGEHVLRELLAGSHGWCAVPPAPWRPFLRLG